MTDRSPLMLGKKLSDLCVTYVGNFFKAGNENFENYSRKADNCLKCKQLEYEKIQFTRAYIEKKPFWLGLYQSEYIMRHELLSFDVSFSF